MEHECKGAPRFCGECGKDVSPPSAIDTMLSDIRNHHPGFRTIFAIKRLRDRYGFSIHEAIEHIHTTLVG